MSDTLVQYFVGLLKQITLPTSTTITEDGQEIFERGCDVMLTYRGHYDTLMQALRLFLATEIRPYACAGIAQVLNTASYISGDESDPEGERLALQWFTQAQETNPYRFEINVLEPGFYSFRKDRQKVRALLDRLGSNPEARSSFRYALGEMWYWDRANDLSLVRQWNETAFGIARNNIQRLYALNALAGIYLGKRMNDDALALYHEVVKINPRDPWAWHNMSILYRGKGDYANAGNCNDRALRIMDFGAARDVQKSLVARWSKTRHADVLADVPPYKVEQPKTGPERKRFLRGG